MGNKPLKITHLATCTYVFSKLYSEFSFSILEHYFFHWKQHWLLLAPRKYLSCRLYYSFLYARFSNYYFFGHITDSPHLSPWLKNAFERKGRFLFHKCIWMKSYAFKHDLSTVSSDKERKMGKNATWQVKRQMLLVEKGPWARLAGTSPCQYFVLEKSRWSTVLAWSQCIFLPRQSHCDLYSIGLLAPLSAM